MAEMPSMASLKALRTAEAECRRCPLVQATRRRPCPAKARRRGASCWSANSRATRKTCRAGPSSARPAACSTEALAEAGIDRDDASTSPTPSSTSSSSRAASAACTSVPTSTKSSGCHWWLDFERRIVKPAMIVVALGATALRSIRASACHQQDPRPRAAGRRRPHARDHPPLVYLRIEDDADKRAQYRKFVADLKACANAAADKA